MNLQTLATVLCLASVLQAVALYAQYRANEARDGLGWWTLGSVAFALGFAANALCGLPRVGAVAIVVTNVLFIAAALMNHAGLGQFFHLGPRPGRMAAVLGAALALTAWWTFGSDSMAARRAILSGTLAAISFLIARTLRKHRTPAIATSVNFLTLVFGLFGGFFLARAASPFLPGPPDGLFTPTPLQVATYLVAFAGCLLWNFGFIIMVNQRLDARSREAAGHMELAQEALEANNQFLTGLVENNGALIYVKDPEGRYELVNRKWEDVTGMARQAVLGRTDAALFPGPVGQAFRRMDQGVLSRGAVAEEEEVLPGPGGERWFLSTKFPLRAPDGTVRGLCGMASEITQRKRDEARIQELVTQLEIERDFAQASAQTDGLTLLANRRQFDEVLNNEFYRLKRSGAPLSLILLDVDHFKAYNDTFGHLAGDDCLRRIAQALKAAVGRSSDLAARYGGEEFAVILPETGRTGARAMAERLRQAVADLALPHPGNSAADHVTVSLGVVTGTASGLVATDTLIQSADTALYRAKEAGRNRVELADPAAPANDLAPLAWHGNAESGHPVIDREHQALFRRSNTLLAAILDGGSREDCLRLIEELVAELTGHFQDEEGILRAAGYPQAEAHAGLHADLLARATGLKGRYERGNLAIGDLFGFLAYEVVAQHMYREDRKFFPYV